MKILDADDSPLVGKGGVKEVRDIVQFVPLRDYADINLLAKVWDCIVLFGVYMMNDHQAKLEY